MSANTKIEWSERTWNPLVGCTKVSSGCDRCYAKTMHERFNGPGSFDSITLHPERLVQPLRWRKPAKVFVNSMSDLFHKDVPDDFIAQVFAVMASAPQHTFQLLTKRHARMRALLTSLEFRHAVARAMDALQVDRADDGREFWAPVPTHPAYEVSSRGAVRRDGSLLKQHINPQTGRAAVSLWRDNEPITSPVHRLVLLAHDPQGASPGAEACHRNGDKTDNRLVNLRWGSRAENQAEKVRHGSRGGPAKLTGEQVEEIRSARLSGATQQAVADRFGVSRPLISMIENGRAWAGPQGLTWPLPNLWLGVSVEDQRWADIRIPALLATPAAVRWISAEPLLGPVDLLPHMPGVPYWEAREAETWGLDWVVAGGESGPGARPMHPDWARQLRDQCTEAGVSFLFKQWGAWTQVDLNESRLPDLWVNPDATTTEVVTAHSGNVAAGAVVMRRVSKKAAGRELDGRTWDEYPEVAA